MPEAFKNSNSQATESDAPTSQHTILNGLTHVLTLSKGGHEVRLACSNDTSVGITPDSASRLKGRFFGDLFSNGRIWKGLVVRGQSGTKINLKDALYDAAGQISPDTPIEEANYFYAITQYLRVCGMPSGTSRDSLFQEFKETYDGKIIGGVGTNAVDNTRYKAFEAAIYEKIDSTRAVSSSSHAHDAIGQSSNTADTTVTKTDTTESKGFLSSVKIAFGGVVSKVSEHGKAVFVAVALGAWAAIAFVPLNLLATGIIVLPLAVYALFIPLQIVSSLLNHKSSTNMPKAQSTHRTPLSEKLRGVLSGTANKIKSIALTSAKLTLVAAGIVVASIAAMGVLYAATLLAMAHSGAITATGAAALKAGSVKLGNLPLIAGSLAGTILLALLLVKKEGRAWGEYLSDMASGTRDWIGRHPNVTLLTFGALVASAAYVFVGSALTLSELVLVALTVPWWATTWAFSVNFVRWARSDHHISDLVMKHKGLTVFDAAVGAVLISYGAIPIMLATPFLALAALWPAIMYLGKKHLTSRDY